MSTKPKKRSLTLKGHRTSVSIEDKFWEEFLFFNIQEHYEKSSSLHAKFLLDNWEKEKYCFWQIIPKEMINKFKQPVLVDEIKSA